MKDNEKNFFIYAIYCSLKTCTETAAEKYFRISNSQLKSSFRTSGGYKKHEMLI